MRSSRQCQFLPRLLRHDHGNRGINYRLRSFLSTRDYYHTSSVFRLSSAVNAKNPRNGLRISPQSDSGREACRAALVPGKPIHVSITQCMTSSSSSKSSRLKATSASHRSRSRKEGFAAFLPESWVPYTELVRLDKPTGIYYLFFPCLFSTFVAAPLATPVVVLPEVLKTAALFFIGAVVMRGAGCTINDLWDRNLDPYVERTKFRPIARGAISPPKAIVFTGAQLLTGLGVLIQFPSQCLWYGIPSLLLVATYPLAKRVTNYPQFVLGLTYSWGAIMGFPAFGVDLFANSNTFVAAVSLYSSCVAWTVLYDMIYAQMDMKDDAAAGIKSIALQHQHNTKAVLSSLAVAQVAMLAGTGAAVGAGPIFFLGSCGSSIIALGTMIWRVRLDDVQNCWWWFKNGCWLTGGGIALGLFGDYLARIFGLYESDERELDLLA